MTFQRILFPIDFSDRCTETAPFVARVARKFNSKVFLLHAIEPESLFSSIPEVATTAISGYELTIERLQGSLETFSHADFAGLDVSLMLKAEEPAKAIAHYAAQNKIDLIIMPTHGRGAFRRLLLGSITSKVLHDTECAVLTTAHSESLAGCPDDPQNILCAIDLGDENLPLIAKASELAAVYGTSARLVHAVAMPQPAPEFPIDPNLVDEIITEARKRIADLQARAGTHWDVCVQAGDVGAVVSSAARGFNAGLVLIGRGKLNRRLGQLRTHVSSIIRQSPCPVLSIPQAG